MRVAGWGGKLRPPRQPRRALGRHRRQQQAPKRTWAPQQDFTALPDFQALRDEPFKHPPCAGKYGNPEPFCGASSLPDVANYMQSGVNLGAYQPDPPSHWRWNVDPEFGFKRPEERHPARAARRTLAPNDTDVAWRRMRCREVTNDRRGVMAECGKPRG